MKYVPFDERSVYKRLEQLCKFREVGLIGDLSEVDANQRIAAKSAYVLFGREDASALVDSRQIEQEFDVEFGVLLVARNAKIAIEVDEMREMRNQVRLALMGWIPPGCSAPITSTGAVKLPEKSKELNVILEKFSTLYQLQVSKSS